MIINSILDLDFYKLTVMQFVMSRPELISEIAEYKFQVRNQSLLDDDSIEEREFREALMDLSKLHLTTEERAYLQNLKVDGEPVFNDEFLDFLSKFRFQPMFHLDIRSKWEVVARGKILDVILYETFVTAIFNELYKNVVSFYIPRLAEERLEEKLELLNGDNVNLMPKIFEFGTRRRSSAHFQRHVLERLRETKAYAGTSNVLLAMETGEIPVGTFGHEGPMMMQGVYHPLDSQRKFLEAWHDFYKGQFSIALTDTLGDDKFFREFNGTMAHVYKGLRHDSGCPIKFGRRVLEFYKQMGVDSADKMIVFSDGLDIPECIHLNNLFAPWIDTGFGIGTNLTNDGFVKTVPSAVMKLVSFKGRPVCKLSNDSGKNSCVNQNYLDWMKASV